jgi:hypothetical protein
MSLLRRLRPITYCCHLGLINSNTMAYNYMTQKTKLLTKQLTFWCLDMQTVFCQAIENSAHMLPMQSNQLAIDQYVIKINNNTYIQEVKEHCMHKSLKGGWGIPETKGHYSLLKGPITTIKCHFALIPGIHHYLMIAVRTWLVFCIV